ncbi:MAG: hypothetical protein JKX97_04980, partial [Candidatus Lindowbacteria bacterium]|nr:hypothetical protein [Candidatus Lindowbacteria bacterium]
QAKEYEENVAALEKQAIALREETIHTEKALGDSKHVLNQNRKEIVAIEKERSKIAKLEVGELRSLLKDRETRERDRLNRLHIKYKGEFTSLKDEWMKEEELGTSSRELKKLRDDVEEKRLAVAKADRQLSAMRAGVSKLREENGRTLIKQIRSYEVQDLEILGRRQQDVGQEIGELHSEWDSEVRNTDIMERQWFEIKTSAEQAD